MKIPYKQLMLLVFLYLTTVFFAGCVDTSVNPIPSSIDYSSQMKVVNLATGAGSASLTLNGQNLGSVPFGEEFPNAQAGFLTIPSGSKTLVAAFDNGRSKSFRFSATTEYKFRVFLVGDAADTTGPSVVIVNQRYIWQTKDSENGQKLFPADTAWVSVFNGSPDITINSITIGTNANEFDAPLGLGQSSAYLKNSAGNFTVEITYNDTETLSFSYDFSARSRYTIALYDVSANLKYAVLVDD
ncbi:MULTISPECIES: DUF4397 domain-containing protein [Ignavibacterium]|jgi:hypothetical protein|uniref:DUF4397 domain-containing protein n=1 Tax=Ignavibacterium TaxID=795750 RepID=UPI0025BFC130|nr:MULTISPECIES: DUF4397 domain-containing protein [Ignavibacterium]MBI5662098.1 DUF4397 domain-containing protein [Ignavibacterium album]